MKWYSRAVRRKDGKHRRGGSACSRSDFQQTQFPAVRDPAKIPRRLLGIAQRSTPSGALAHTALRPGEIATRKEGFERAHLPGQDGDE